jgi:hypothetical protein
MLASALLVSQDLPSGGRFVSSLPCGTDRLLRHPPLRALKLTQARLQNFQLQRPYETVLMSSCGDFEQRWLMFLHRMLLSARRRERI